MTSSDYYEILGVSPGADETTVRDAFRHLARQVHPDVNPGDPQAQQTFQIINEAYQVLSHPHKRRLYDQFGTQWRRYEQLQAYTGPFATAVRRTNIQNPAETNNGFTDQLKSSEFQSSVYVVDSQLQSHQGGVDFSTGADVHLYIRITLEEAYCGTKVRLDDRHPEGAVAIPAGSYTGMCIRVPGAGAVNTMGGVRGDLYLDIIVLPHAYFTCADHDLETSVSVDPLTAAEGGSILVQTLDGPVQLPIPPNTQSGQLICFQGKGMPRLDQPGTRGDLLVHIDVRPSPEAHQ